MLSGKNILIGITGGIAAYKICELIRMFKRANADVRVVCTPNALNFITKLTLQNLSQNEVGVEEFDVSNFKPEHISYADEADIMIIAPATANTISKIAHGICDNLLTSIVCAFKKPIIIAPAMNCNMWENPIIQDNLHKLSSLGCKILEPESGFLACGYEGKGRLCELNKIFETAKETLFSENFEKKHLVLISKAEEPAANLHGKKIVITAGGTIEDIDPVRYISNYSSGKMGLALADAAQKSGAEVILITTKDFERSYKIVKVKSALEMQKALDAEFLSADYIFMSAAVADYRVKNKAEQKIKKTSENEFTLELVKNPDILAGLCLRRKLSTYNKKSPIITGFCAETQNLIEYAKNKIQKKGCDFIIANDVSRKDIGFSADENEVYIINNNLEVKKLEKQSKTVIAREILKEVYEQSRNLCNIK